MSGSNVPGARTSVDDVHTQSKRPMCKGTSDMRTNPRGAKFCTWPYLQGEPFAISMQREWLARECEPARYMHS
jgi:hypothetical protein